MASIVASRRAVPLVRALEKLIAASSAPGTGSALRPVAVAGGLRGYNTGAPLRRYEGAESEDDSVREYDGRHGGRDYAVPSLFSGSRHLRFMPDPFALLSQLSNEMVVRLHRFEMAVLSADFVLLVPVQIFSVIRLVRRTALAAC
jgi:hypothetical protein